MVLEKKVSLSILLITCFSFSFTLQSFNDIAKNDPVSEEISAVIVDPDGRISQGENNYTDKRENKVHLAQERFLKKRLSQHKKWGLCYSGGGYRAMISSLGFMQAAEKIRLRQAATYDSSLSGSTWNHILLFFRKIFDQERKKAEQIKQEKILQEQKNQEEPEQKSGFFANTWSTFIALKNYLPKLPSFLSKSEDTVEPQAKVDSDPKEEEVECEALCHGIKMPASGFSEASTDRQADRDHIQRKEEEIETDEDENEEDNFFEKFRAIMKKQVEPKFWNPFTFNWHNILGLLEKKHKAYGHITWADIWGALLIDRLLSDMPEKVQSLSFALLRKFLKETDSEPYPIFSACIKTYIALAQMYGWWETGPHTSGSDDLKGFIPTKFLGSFFESGKLIKALDQEDASFLMGLFGSAYDFNIGDVLLLLAQGLPDNWIFEDFHKNVEHPNDSEENTLESLLLHLIKLIPEKYTCASKIIELVRKLIKKHDLHLEKYINKKKIIEFVEYINKKYNLCKKNFLPSRINNPTNKMESSPYSGPYLELADAGYDYNNPFIPLLARDTDIIFCWDASTDACSEDRTELKKARKSAFKYGYTDFPSLKYCKPLGESKHAYLYKWDNEGRPCKKALFYFMLPEEDDVSTLKLSYSGEEFDKICNTPISILNSAKKAIKEELCEICE